MSYRGGWRPHIESALCLSLGKIMADGLLVPGCIKSGTLRWNVVDTGEEVASLGYRAEMAEASGALTLNYTHTNRAGVREPVECVIRLESEPCRYGGRRWYFFCPCTGKRALKLYKWNGIDKFCHRDAVRPKPTYSIQRTSGSDRINQQRWAIRHKIGDRFSDLFGEPVKPKWMRWRTFEQHARRDAELVASELPYFSRFLGRLGK